MRDFFRPLIFNPVIAIEACSKLLDGLLAPEGMLGVAGVLEPEDAAGDVSSFTRRYASYHTFQHLFFIFLLTCSASLAKYMYKGKQKTKHLLRFLIIPQARDIETGDFTCIREGLKLKKNCSFSNYSTHS